jgi:1,4-alpha-glucan branching enzyme
MWIPECGYYPGLDDILKEAGIKYFFIDTHGLIYGRPAPRFGAYQPARCPSGVAAFARDAASSKEVWSSVEGYPGDFNYREFYRDIGFDLPADYIKPYIHPDGIRVDTGMKYYRITGKTENKEPYVREKALETAREHAGNFLSNREKQAAYFADLLGITTVITAPYDAELFGHWWFEGADWLNFLIRKTAGDSEIIKFITPSEYLNSGVELQTVLPTQSSWGWKGYSETWLNDLNEWIYQPLHEAARKMSEMARENPDARGVALRALNQAARELLLAQSSDWPFMMAKKTVSDYAGKRVKEHLQWFNQLYSGIKSGAVDVERLGHLEKINNIFRDIDYRVYSLDYELSNLSKG